MKSAFDAMRSKIALRTRLDAYRKRSRARRLFHKYEPYTMIGPDSFVSNIELSINALRNPVLRHAAVIECGCWRGGMSAALIEIGGKDRDYCFFDSFEGLPPAKEIDGKAAIEYQRDTTSPLYRDNCAASQEEFEYTISLASSSRSRVHVVKGFFETTLPNFPSRPIGLLRLDADWYESTAICLNKFWDDILPGGIVLIDDYYMWDGCSRAVHDFLSSRKATERIKQGSAGLAYIEKQATVA